MPVSRAPWWTYLLVASWLGCVLMGVFIRVRGPEPPFPAYRFEHGALVPDSVLPGSAAARAGLQVGDRVVAFDGVPTRGRGDWDILEINVEVGRPYAITFERAGRRQSTTLTLQPRSSLRLPPVDRASAIVNLAEGLVFVLLATFVVVSRPRDQAAVLGALILAMIAAWATVPAEGTGPAFRQLPALLGPLVWWPLAGGFLFPSALFVFCATFPRPLFRARWAWLLALTPTGLFLLPIAAIFYVTFVDPRANNASAFDPGFLPRIGGSILASYLVAAIAAIAVNYRRLGPGERRRVRVLAVGTIVSIAGLVPRTVFKLANAPASGIAGVFYSSEHELLLSVLFLALPISWSYAIVRHRLFDIRVIVRQGLQYALARRVLLAVGPALAVLLLVDLVLHSDQPLIDILRARGWIYVAVAVLALVANARRERWLAALDRRFFRERYDAHALLRTVVEDVRQGRDFARVGPQAVHHIEQALHSQFVALLTREPGESAYRPLAVAPAGASVPAVAADGTLMAMLRLLNKPLEVSQSASGWLREQLPPEEAASLRQQMIELVVPIAVRPGHPEALLLLGSKRSEEPYAGEDRDLLGAIAASLAMLLETRATPGRSDLFEECPQCGVCYDSGTMRCAHEGATLAPVLLPRRLDNRYLLARRLGRGGMGTVYEASDVALERRVAVKVVREDLVGSPDAAERFRREAQAAAGFTHVNVVTVHDFGIAGASRAFLVMELLEGETLRAARAGDPRWRLLRAYCGAPAPARAP